MTQKLLEPYWSQWRLDTDFLVTRLPLVAQHREQPQLVALTLERWLLELKACLGSMPDASACMRSVLLAR